MESNEATLCRMIRLDARSGLERYLPRIVRCLRMLDEKEIWWRPNRASNAAGNIVLHLCGNVRQWVISGLGGSPDVRQRDAEFRECGPLPRRVLIEQLTETVAAACEAIDRLSNEALRRKFKIQGYEVPGLVALLHVYEHFSYHTGQIIYLAKLKTGRDLSFTHLPGEKRGAQPSKSLHP